MYDTLKETNNGYQYMYIYPSIYLYIAHRVRYSQGNKQWISIYVYLSIYLYIYSAPCTILSRKQAMDINICISIYLYISKVAQLRMNCSRNVDLSYRIDEYAHFFLLVVGTETTLEIGWLRVPILTASIMQRLIRKKK